jgi:hypothetical protein
VARAKAKGARVEILNLGNLDPAGVNGKLILTVLGAIAAFEREMTPKVTGRPAYAPGDLLKLYIYGYLNRVRSSRRLEAETPSPGGRQPGDTELLLDCYRDAEQWQPLAFSERRVGGSSGSACSVEIAHHDGVDLRIQCLDAGDRAIDQFARRHLALCQRLNQLSRGAIGHRIVAGAGLHWQHGVNGSRAHSCQEATAAWFEPTWMSSPRPERLLFSGRQSTRRCLEPQACGSSVLALTPSARHIAATLGDSVRGTPLRQTQRRSERDKNS